MFFRTSTSLSEALGHKQTQFCRYSPVDNEALQSVVVPERSGGFSLSIGCAVFMKQAGAAYQARGKMGTLLNWKLENRIATCASS